MKRVVYALIAFCLVFSYKASATNSECFSTEVVKAELKDNGCIDYQLKVSYNGDCAHALSHYTVAVSCGTISNVSNSENWKLVYGKDPKTGLYGFKVDDIPDFGDTSLKSFTVSFTVCLDGNKQCSTKDGCCYPIVAYKAGTYIYYDRLKDACPSPAPAPELKASLTKNDISCYGAKDGSLTLVVETGKEPYTYVWSTNATSQAISNLAAGAYEVIVKDANGLTVTLKDTINEPSPIEIIGSVINESCSGKNGGINLVVSGGTGKYTYNWSNSATTEDLSSLAVGSYKVIVTDEKGCVAESTYTITNQSSLTVTGAVTMPGCGQTNGGLDITVSGGTAPYTYQWSNGVTTEDLQNVGPGTYRVTIADAGGCTAEAAYAVKENNTLKLTYAVTQTTCLDNGSGAIDLTVQGGTAPYTFAWSNGATTEDISGLTAGFYTITVTDNAGCTSTIRISVTKKSFIVYEQVVQPACETSQGGSITLNPSGGVEPYTYVWSNGSTGSSVSGLAPGIYTVIVTDATGCSRNLAYVISEPSGITSTATVTNDQCNAEGKFDIDISVSGGQGPYTYQWSNGAITEDLTDVETGNYSVTITDVNGCSTVSEVQVTGGSTWACLINQPSGEILCSSTGNSLSTSITDVESYSWTVVSSDNQWSITTGSSTSSIQYTAGGANSTATFTLTIVKDGCTQTCEYVVTTCKEDETTPPDDSDDDGSDDDDGTDDGDDDGGDDGDDDNGGDDGSDDGSDDDGDNDGGDDDGNDDGDDGDDGGDDNGDDDDGDGDNGDDDDGDGDNDSGDGDGSDDGDDDDQNGSCEDCFESDMVEVTVDGSCYTYEVKVLTNGECRHDLSHWSIAIPCGTITHYSNSENWKMVVGKDPTTGIYGLKVDDINNFGNTSDYFTVRFTICYDNYECKDKLKNWDPIVAYKAGQCIAYDTLNGSDTHYEDDDNETPVCTAYPNPYRDKLYFEWKADRDEEASLEIYDSQGHHVKDVFKGRVYKGERYKVECTDLDGSLYIYRFRSGNKTSQGKICKTR